MHAVEIDRLWKSYGRLVAVRDLTLQVAPGEAFGFLGLNGAGKTTTLRILLDLLRPGAGRARVLGLDCQTRGLEVRARVGYMPGDLGLYGDMTGARALELMARLGGGPRRDSCRRRLLDRLELSSSDLRRRLREYSTGMKRKLGIVLALQGSPELMILDEPTEGLDPLMQEAVYGILAEARGEGRTVFMSSHVLSEVERVCDRIGLIRDGHLALLASVSELRSLAPRRLTIDFSADVLPPAALPAERIETHPRRWILHARGPLGPLLAALRDLPVADVVVQEPRLEDVIVPYYRGRP